MRKSYIYAETAFHHEGDINFLYRLIAGAAEAGVHGVKFQILINFDELISKHNPAYEKLKQYTFSTAQWTDIFNYTLSHNLQIIAMPLDPGSLDLMKSFKGKIKFVELHSVSYYDTAVKEAIKKSGIDLLLGVGGRTREEIQDAQTYFGDQLKILMVGFQAFPSKIEDIRLRKISELRQQFPDLAIGYADHSSFADSWCIDSNLIAYALGATVFEKHLTLNEGEKRVDFESAIGVEKLKIIKEKLESMHNILHSYPDAFEMTRQEQAYRDRQKMAVASRDLFEGQSIQESDIALKMTGDFTGFPSKEALIGKMLKKDVKSDSIIKQEDVYSEIGS
jgi:N,N'-diacetyllegionaminate synthase